MNLHSGGQNPAGTQAQGTGLRHPAAGSGSELTFLHHPPAYYSCILGSLFANVFVDSTLQL